MIFICIILFIICVGLIIYFLKRERKILNRLQEMLDHAVLGTFEDHCFDETKLSLIENTMWRYLSDHELFTQKITKRQEQMQILISNIAHQVVTPISNIILYSQILEENYLSKQEIKADQESIKQTDLDEIYAIKEQAEKLDFLIQSLVKLSRLETGIITINVKKQSIEMVLSALKQQFLAKAAQKEIQFKVKDSKEMAVFDKKWTIEAIANLVDNAIKYTGYAGMVLIYVEVYSIFLRINVRDTGIGIPETEQANIFTRFYRCKAVSEVQGVGIGLYLAREIIKAENGYIKVTSKEGQGSEFSVFLLRDIS